MILIVSLPGLLDSTEGYSEDDLRVILTSISLPVDYKVTYELLSPSVQIRGGTDQEAAQDLFSRWCRALEQAMTEFDTSHA